MQKVSNVIFNLSPKKIASYLLLGPLLLFLVHTIVTIIIRNISETSAATENILSVILGILFLILVTLVLLCFLWLRSAVYSVSESDLGLSRRWFTLALGLFIFYLLSNSCYFLVEYIEESYRHIFYALNEFISFGGVLIAYPVICHYAARAITSKRNGEPATFVNTLPFTLLLLFGTVLGIPFMHKHLSKKTSTNNQILMVYAVAFGICILIFIIGFIAAITGLV